MFCRQELNMIYGAYDTTSTSKGNTTIKSQSNISSPSPSNTDSPPKKVDLSLQDESSQNTSLPSINTLSKAFDGDGVYSSKSNARSKFTQAKDSNAPSNPSTSIKKRRASNEDEESKISTSPSPTNKKLKAGNDPSSPSSSSSSSSSLPSQPAENQKTTNADGLKACFFQKNKLCFSSKNLFSKTEMFFYSCIDPIL